MTTDLALEVAVEQEWRRLDRRSIWVAPLKPLAGLLATGLVIVTFRGWEQVGVVEPVIGVAVAIGVFVLSVWYWATTRYRITATHVEVSSGMVVRKHRSVARDRLRSVDITADVVHRVAGIAVVAIGTGRQGGESDDALKLDSVAAAEAEHLRELLLTRGEPAGQDRVAPSTPPVLARFDGSWVRLAPFSLLGLVALGLLAAGAGQLVRAAGGDDVYRSGPVQAAFEWVLGIPVLPAVLVVLVALVVLNAVLSTVLYVLLYGGYELVRGDDGTLRITYGMLTRRSVSIEGRRIRGVRVVEPLLLRLGGGARAKIVAAGLGAKGEDGKDKHDSDMLVPTAPAGVVHRVTAAVLGVDTPPATLPLRAHPRAALRVLLVLWLAVAAVPAVVLWVLAVVDLFPHWPWQAALVLLVPAAACAWLEHRNLGHTLTPTHLIARGGSTVRRTVAVRRDGIIAWRFRRTVLQRRARLLTATAAVAAGKGAEVIEYAAQDDVLATAREAVPGLLTPFLEPDS